MRTHHKDEELDWEASKGFLVSLQLASLWGHAEDWVMFHVAEWDDLWGTNCVHLVHGDSILQLGSNDWARFACPIPCEFFCLSL